MTKVRFAHSDGLVYPLDGLVLAPGVRTGTSNAAVGGPVRIEPDAGSDGVYLLVLPVGELPQLLGMKAP